MAFDFDPEHRAQVEHAIGQLTLAAAAVETHTAVLLRNFLGDIHPDVADAVLTSDRLAVSNGAVIRIAKSTYLTGGHPELAADLLQAAKRTDHLARQRNGLVHSLIALSEDGPVSVNPQTGAITPLDAASITQLVAAMRDHVEVLGDLLARVRAVTHPDEPKVGRFRTLGTMRQSGR